MIREGMVFYRSFYDAVKDLEEKDFKEVVISILEYGLNGEEKCETPLAKAILTMAKPQIDKNNKRYENSKKSKKAYQTVTKLEPNTNQNETKREPNCNQSVTNLEPKVKVKDKVKDKVKVNVKENSKEKTKEKTFTKPTLEEIRAYCVERNSDVDADKFYNYYESIGWKVGKNPMKSWKACIATWERRDYSQKRITVPLPKHFTNKSEDFDIEVFLNDN